MSTVEISKTKDGITVTLAAHPIGCDYSILVYGGDEPHIGAISYGSCFGDVKTIALGKHKEWIVNERIVPILRNAFYRDFVLVCGIHIDNATNEQIEIVMELCEDLAFSFVNMTKG